MDRRPSDPGAEALIAELRAENAALRAKLAEQRPRVEETSGSLDLGALLASVESPDDGALQSVALRQSRMFLVALLQNSPSVIFVKDAQGRYVMVNRMFTELMEASADQILGRTDAEVFSPEVGERVRRLDEEAISAGQPLQFEESIPSRRGGMRDYFTVKFPLRTPGGQLLGLCGISTDITERRRAEAERAALQDQVIEAQRAALRELSTPLMPIAQGVLAMPLVGTIDSVRAKEILETLLEGIARQRARTAILDITGVRVVDTQVASALVESARAARLLGAEVLLTGISPAIAQTLVGLELDLHDITTLSTLQAGIAHALRGARAGRR